MNKPTGSIRSVCVFCSSSNGRNCLYAEAASELGRELVSRNIGLVYGGAATPNDTGRVDLSCVFRLFIVMSIFLVT